MTGNRSRLLVSTMLVFGIASAWAQDAKPPPAPARENVTVTGIKDIEAAVSKFVEGMTVPTRAAGKLARWKDGVCPMVLGVRPEIGKDLVKAIKDVATEVGAPVNTSDTCPNNIEVIFTAEPQAMLDNIRIMHPNLLGYFDNSAQAEKLATMRAPIQSWYITATMDRHGQAQVDGARKAGTRIMMMVPPSAMGGPRTAPTMVTMDLPNATTADATDGRLGDGMSSTVTNVLIVADTSKLLNGEVSILADYISMLALSQVQTPDSCQDLPTILNLLVPDCSRTTPTLTAADLAYLRALYKVTTTANVSGQRDEIMYQMKKTLGAGQ